MKSLENIFVRDFIEAMKILEEKYSIKLSLSNFKYENNRFSAILQSQRIIDGKTIDQIDFEQNCRFVNLQKSDYNRKFCKFNKEYRLVGINLDSPSYPYVGVDQNNNKFRFSSINF